MPEGGESPLPSRRKGSELSETLILPREKQHTAALAHGLGGVWQGVQVRPPNGEPRLCAFSGARAFINIDLPFSRAAPSGRGPVRRLAAHGALLGSAFCSLVSEGLRCHFSCAPHKGFINAIPCPRLGLQSLENKNTTLKTTLNQMKKPLWDQVQTLAPSGEGCSKTGRAAGVLAADGDFAL